MSNQQRRVTEPTKLNSNHHIKSGSKLNSKALNSLVLAEDAYSTNTTTIVNNKRNDSFRITEISNSVQCKICQQTYGDDHLLFNHILSNHSDTLTSSSSTSSSSSNNDSKKSPSLTDKEVLRPENKAITKHHRHRRIRRTTSAEPTISLSKQSLKPIPAVTVMEEESTIVVDDDGLDTETLAKIYGLQKANDLR